MSIRKEKKEKLMVRTPDRPKRGLVEQQPKELWTDFDRLFDQFRSNFEDLFWSPPSEMMIPPLTTRAPPSDVIDLGDKYKVTLEMPGVSKENIDIEVTSNEVEVSAENKTEFETEDKNWLRHERSSMSFYRDFVLPEELKTDGVDAEFKNGVLTLILPKLEPKPRHEPKKINIK
jgi:HSP20 family protein